MKFSLIIPTVRQTSMVKTCIEAIRQFEVDSDYEVIVVDDGSDASVQGWLRDYCAKWGHVRYLPQPENKGFSHTVNIGLKAARGEYLVLVNNDVQFIQPALRNMMEAFRRDPAIGVVGAKLLYMDGTVQHAGVVRIPGTSSFIHRDKHVRRESPVVNGSRYFISVTGALFGISRKAYEKIGPFNENYFLAFEDTEYCLRTWEAGFRVYYAHDVEAIHAEGGTRGNTDSTKLQKGPKWFLKERETFAKFQRDFPKFRTTEYEKEVVRLNQGGKPALLGEKILVRRAGAMGDVLMTTPIVRRLRQENPDAVIHVATNSPEVYANNPRINEVVSPTVPVQGYAKVVDLDLAYERQPERHVVDAYSAVAFGDGIDYDKSLELFPTENDRSFVASLQASGPEVVVVHMAVTWKNRTWPADYWGRTIDGLRKSGCTVVQVGSGSDFVFRPCPGSHGLIDLTKRLTLQQIAVLVENAGCFVGNDSGLLHVAGTTKTPIVGLFTSVRGMYRSAYREGSYGAGTAVVEPDISCKGCHHRQKAPVVYSDCHRGDYACLGLLTPEMVVETTLKQMGRL